MSLNSARAPFPGLAWGCYPERRADDADIDPWSRMRGIGRRGQARVQGLMTDAAGWRNLRFARRVAGEMATHASRPRNELVGALLKLQPRLARDGLVDRHLLRALALLGELCRREIGQAPYPTQIMAVHAMLGNRLAEMATGEGKTLAAGLAATLAALAGIPVHLVTANDYLVQRDHAGMRPLFAALGLSSGEILAGSNTDQRRHAYASAIVYCTARELAFDYLRDRVGANATRVDLRWLTGAEEVAAAPLLRGLCMAIIDEADSILLDEACTPLILAIRARDRLSNDSMTACMAIARMLWAGRDYRINRAYRRVTLTESGRRRIVDLAGQQEAPAMHGREREAQVATALAAIHCYRLRHDYLVEDDKVVMIDAPTGRKADGRTWSRGLHQMIELKERVTLTGTNETIAQITYQQFFGRYLRLCGMSGSLSEARTELFDIYRMPVRTIPLHRPSLRRRHRTRIHTSVGAKWHEVVRIAREAQGRRRATLLAVDSVESAARLSELLARAGVAHRRLDAGEHAQEAEIIAQAGRAGAVTVATNMAGRGTDIVPAPEVLRTGGLLTVVCHYNRERRIDRQMFGRAARQGQPGDVLRVVSLDDITLFSNDPDAVRMLQRIARPLPGALARAGIRAVFKLAQRLHEARQRRVRYRILAAGYQRERLLAVAGRGE
ncbi:MAG: prepilin peptidase [Burkholderiaceae bacterium]